MTRQELLETAWKNRTDCIIINYFTDEITFVRRDKEETFSEKCIDVLAEKLMDKLVSNYPLEVRACDLKGIVVLGREKGFERLINKMNIKDKIEPIG